MSTKARIGSVVGGMGIAVCMLCFLVMPAFGGAMIVAAMFGIPAAATALALNAKRTAIVASVFVPVPFLGFLLLQQDFVGSGYIAFLSPGVAVVVGVLALIHYSNARRAKVMSTA